MKFFKNKYGFTFVELVVAMFISSIVLTAVFYFIANSIDEITSSTKRTEFYNSFYEFRDKFLYFSNIYSSWNILVDNSTSSWSDIILLQNSMWTDGVLIWVVDQNIYRLESTAEKYNQYYNKSPWYRRLSEYEINLVKTNSGAIYDIEFTKNNTYDKVTVRDFQVYWYNSWTILNVDLTLMSDINESLVWQTWDNLRWQEFFKFNLNF